MGWGLFKQMVCKIASKNIHNIRKKPNQTNYYIKTEADSLENLSNKITWEALPLSDERICWKKTKW